MTHMNSTIKYPNIVVDLSTIDGNAFSVMGAVTRAMSRAGVDLDEINQYRREATSGNYDNLLAVTMNWVSIDYSNDGLMVDEDYDDLDYDDDGY